MNRRRFNIPSKRKSTIHSQNRPEHGNGPSVRPVDRVRPGEEEHKEHPETPVKQETSASKRTSLRILVFVGIRLHAYYKDFLMWPIDSH